MWLINTSNFTLVDHHECPVRQYAILSHTWEEEEVSFQDFKDLALARQKKGFRKIEHAVYLARQDHLKWAWVDTCCIDKSSSAELSKAINSMFKWYQHSAICYAFLSDLTSNPQHQLQAFMDCRWWTRGWTLQELIAPNRLLFFDQDWNSYRSRSDLQDDIESFTGIDSRAFHGLLDEFSVAERMSWASRRDTARIEDVAYCLLGLFNVNMPLIYGEGDKAFVRLQEEICKDSTDMTIFAWTLQPSLRMYTRVQQYYGLFASHPALFADCADVHQKSPTQYTFQHDMSIVSKGIRLDDMSLRLDEDHGLLMYIAGTKRTELSLVFLFIYLTKTTSGYVRSRPDRLAGTLPVQYKGPPLKEINTNSSKISIIHNTTDSRTTILPRSRVSCPKLLAYTDSRQVEDLYDNALFISVAEGVKVYDAYPETFWAPDKRAFIMKGSLTGAIFLGFYNGLTATTPNFVLLFRCPDVPSNKRWEHIKFKLIRAEYDRRAIHDWEGNDRLAKQIKEEKMTTFESVQNVARAIRSIERGGWVPAEGIFEPSLCENRHGPHGLRADVQTHLMDMSKGALRLRISSLASKYQ
ncbi:heterokaryon incompatibility protein-domain-containing protein [Pestalotiopsis sp. NC0098]|nr:heterokaryon incompatibility protein-domain-containing protein [Pestalotiopsis sp. NC0098]